MKDDIEKLLKDMIKNMTDEERLGTIAVGSVKMARNLREQGHLLGMLYDGRIKVDDLVVITIGGGAHYAKINGDAAETLEAGIALPVELVVCLSDASFTGSDLSDGVVDEIVERLREAMAATGDNRSVAIEPLHAAVRRELMQLQKANDESLLVMLRLLEKELRVMQADAQAEQEPKTDDNVVPIHLLH